MVFVDNLGDWCLLKGLSGVNKIFEFGLLVKLLILSSGNVMVLDISGCVMVICDILWMIFLVLFKFVVLGNCVNVIKYCLFCFGI